MLHTLLIINICSRSLGQLVNYNWKSHPSILVKVMNMDEEEVKQQLLVYQNEVDELENNNTVSEPNEDVPTPTLSASVNIFGPDGYLTQEAVDALPNFKVYRRRWYVLLLYSLLGFTQSALWNTWGPISTTSEEAFGWSDASIAWLSNWGCLSYVLTGLLFPWLLQVKGLRWATIISMFLIAVGSICRIITSEPTVATILIHLGQCLNGMAGPIAMAAVPMMSSLWFPPKERVTATAISNSINSLGVAIPFVVGPLLVHSHTDVDNATLTLSSNLHPQILNAVSNTSGNYTEEIHAERHDILAYMYIECAWSCVLFLAILIYFPAKPPLPPCVSAALEREEYWSGLCALRNKANYLCMAFIYSISAGILSVWGSVLNVNLSQSLDIGEKEAGWLGFYSILGGCIVPLLIMRFADLFAHRMKLFILVMYILASVLFILFSLMLIGHIPFSRAMLYTTVIGGSTLVNAAVPIMYELACELAYPTSEGAANGILLMLNNVWGLIFLAVFSVPHVGTMWMNWGLVGSCVVCIPLITVLRARFRRLEMDELISPEAMLSQDIDVSDVSETDSDLPETTPLLGAQRA